VKFSFDFIAVSSYGQKTHSLGQVRLTRDLDSSIEGKTVIVVEDILDTGMTLQYLLRLFAQRKPKHLRVAVAAGQAGTEDRRGSTPTTWDFRSPTNLWSIWAGLRRAIQKPALRWRNYCLVLG